MFDIFPLEGGLSNVDGFYCDGVSVGLKANGGKDVGFIYSDVPCDAVAAFTTNKFQAAPLKHFQRYEEGFKTNFVLMNSKNANAMTGQKGIDDIDDIFKELKKYKNDIINPIMSSTGVIGYRLNKEKISSAFEKFDFNAKNSDATASAIMTTDRFKKEICIQVVPNEGNPFHIAAICKGAGMINPAMATMLCFIVTDAQIPRNDAKHMLKNAVEESFNAVSVDGDTSTNDTVLLLSNGKSENYHKEGFEEGLKLITKHLALELVRDGEGSKKVVAFEVSGAKDDKEAMIAAKALSNSLLMKTAIHGEDPNWGRIASTIGASGITCKEEPLSIHFDEVLVYDYEKEELDKQREALAYKVMQQDSYRIHCDLGIGNGCFTAYGCDLGHEYVTVNADYRT